MDFRAFWEDRVSHNPDKVFLYYQDERPSYRQFNVRVNQVANGLLEKGVRKGNRVCLMLPNSPEFLYSWFGLAKIGGIMVPVNTHFRANEAQYVVNHSEAVGMVVHRDYLQLALDVRPDCPHLKWIACVGESELPPDTVPFQEFLRDSPRELKNFDIGADDPVAVIYTSGTTGFPKGAIHVHRNLIMTGEAFTLAANLDRNDRLMAVLPLYHINAQFYSTMGTIAAEASLILIRQFSASNFWEQAVRYGATQFNFIGAIGRILCARPNVEFRPEHTIVTANGAGISPDVYEAFTNRFHIPNVIDGYGLTEVPRVCQNPIGGLIKMKSMGLPARHPDPEITFSEMKIVDDSGKELPPGEMGELVVRTPVMARGYFKDPERSKEAIRNGWFYTGDYAYRDEEGYFFFIDRKKDIIRRRGENISAREVEGVINEDKRVLEAAVIAVPSELGEDEVMACIVLKPGCSMSPPEVIDWCEARLATFKVPRFVQFRKDLPKTATQRTRKSILREEPDLVDKASDMASYQKKLHT